MTQHTDLIDEQTKAARWLDEVSQYLTAAADSSMSHPNKHATIPDFDDDTTAAYGRFSFGGSP